MKNLYVQRYARHGYGKDSLGWFKGKQEMRFKILTSQVDLEGRSILDLGCGFGDLNYYLKMVLERYSYLGVDCVEPFLIEAREKHPESFINFINADIRDAKLEQHDYVLGSGIFNYKFEQSDNYGYISEVMQKAFSLCKIGMCFDFLSSNVDYSAHDYSFHSKPTRILDLAYALSRNILLRNDYAPFEFSIFIFKDDSYDIDDTIFKRFKDSHRLNLIHELS